MVYWNSIFGVDDVQLEVIPRIASSSHLIPKDLHISWYLCKSSKDIYHNAKQIQEEAERFISSEISKPTVTPAILEHTGRDIIQAIDPHEEFLLSSEQISYHVQVIAMENYLNHQVPVYQEQPPQDPSTGARTRHKGPLQTPGPDYAPLGFMGDWQGFIPALISKSHHLLVHQFWNVPDIDQYQALILNVIHEDKPTTRIAYKVQGTWDTNQEELDFKDNQGSLSASDSFYPGIHVSTI